jgi:hypothetical protein
MPLGDDDPQGHLTLPNTHAHTPHTHSPMPLGDDDPQGHLTLPHTHSPPSPSGGTTTGGNPHLPAWGGDENPTYDTYDTYDPAVHGNPHHPAWGGDYDEGDTYDPAMHGNPHHPAWGGDYDEGDTYDPAVHGNPHHPAWGGDDDKEGEGSYTYDSMVEGDFMFPIVDDSSYDTSTGSSTPSHNHHPSPDTENHHHSPHDNDQGSASPSPSSPQSPQSTSPARPPPPHPSPPPPYEPGFQTLGDPGINGTNGTNGVGEGSTNKPPSLGVVSPPPSPMGFGGTDGTQTDPGDVPKPPPNSHPPPPKDSNESADVGKSMAAGTIVAIVVASLTALGGIVTLLWLAVQGTSATGSAVSGSGMGTKGGLEGAEGSLKSTNDTEAVAPLLASQTVSSMHNVGGNGRFEFRLEQ